MTCSKLINSYNDSCNCILSAWLLCGRVTTQYRPYRRHCSRVSGRICHTYTSDGSAPCIFVSVQNKTHLKIKSEVFLGNIFCWPLCLLVPQNGDQTSFDLVNSPTVSCVCVSCKCSVQECFLWSLMQTHDFLYIFWRSDESERNDYFWHVTGVIKYQQTPEYGSGLIVYKCPNR